MKKIEKKEAIIILLILILAMTIILLLLISSIQRIKRNEININNTNQFINVNENGEIWEEQEFKIPQEEIEEAAKDLLIIENMNEIRAKYKDEKKISFISYKIEDTIKNIFNTAVKSNNLEEFYNSKIEEISDISYVKNFVEFQELINKIFGNEMYTVIKAKILPGSATVKNGIITSTIELILEKGNSILLTIEVDEFTSEIKMF